MPVWFHVQIAQKNLECYLTFKCVHPLACSGRSIQKARAAGGMTHIFFNVIWIVARTDYGHPERAFFHWNLEILCLRKQIGQINSGSFGVFSTKLSAPILIQWVPSPCPPLFNHCFYKELSLYIHIPNIYLGLGFEITPQIIRDSAFVCQ